MRIGSHYPAKCGLSCGELQGDPDTMGQNLERLPLYQYKLSGPSTTNLLKLDTCATTYTLSQLTCLWCMFATWLSSHDFSPMLATASTLLILVTSIALVHAMQTRAPITKENKRLNLCSGLTLHEHACVERDGGCELNTVRKPQSAVSCTLVGFYELHPT